MTILHTILSKQEQLIFEILLARPTEVPIDLVFFAKNQDQTKESMTRQVKNWCAQLLNQPYRKYFRITHHTIQLTCSMPQYLNLFAHLYQQNQGCQILWAITNVPSATISHLAQELHLSPSTIKRTIRNVTTALTPYQIQLSFQSDPILKGCELSIRWLAFCLSLIFDPPFDWFCSQTLYDRFIEIQRLRLHCGQNLNHLSSDKRSFYPTFSFQFSEKAWSYLARQLFGFVDTIVQVEDLPFLLIDRKLVLFLTDYQKRLLKQPSYQISVHFVAEK